MSTAEFPVWSRQGSLIAATGPAAVGARNIFIFRPDGTGLTQVTHIENSLPGPVQAHLDPLFKAFSPDGRWIVYSAISGNADEQITVIVSIDGSRQIIVGAGSAAQFTGWGVDWDPRANLLAIPVASVDYSGPTPADVGAIFLAAPVQNVVQTGRYRQLSHPHTIVPTTVNDVFPAFSPDGSRVAFIRLAKPLNGPLVSQVMVIPTAGGVERAVVTLRGEVAIGVSWSPDGRTLLFDRGPEQVLGALGLTARFPNPGQFGLWAVGVNGGGLRLVVRPPANSASWSWAR